MVGFLFWEVLSVTGWLVSILIVLIIILAIEGLVLRWLSKH